MPRAEIASTTLVQVGFNPQFSWSFSQLNNVHYLWPFNTSIELPEPVNQAALATSNAEIALAEAGGDCPARRRHPAWLGSARPAWHILLRRLPACLQRAYQLFTTRAPLLQLQ